jgi:hypothetical protein
MDEIAGRTDERSRQLAVALQPTFSNREDAELAASMLVSWLQAEHGDLTSRGPGSLSGCAGRATQQRPAPTGVLREHLYQDIEPHWCVTFTLDHTAHESSLRLPTEAAATEYASSFLASWAKMSGR